MSWNVAELNWCSAAILPEKIGVDELDLTVFEDKSFDSHQEALTMIEAEAGLTPVVAVKAVVPKLPDETVKAIEKLRAKLPEAKDKLKALLQLDPETGEPTWRKKMEEEIILRNQAVKVESRSCKGCNSKIATAHIRTFLCPVCLTYEFLTTGGDTAAFAAREEKIKALRTEVEGADRRIAELEAEGIKASDELKRVWLVFKTDARPEAPEEGPATETSPKDGDTDPSGENEMVNLALGEHED